MTVHQMMQSVARMRSNCTWMLIMLVHLKRTLAPWDGQLTRFDYLSWNIYL